MNILMLFSRPHFIGIVLTLIFADAAPVLAQKENLHAKAVGLEKMYSRLTHLRYGDYDRATPVSDSFTARFVHFITNDTGTLRYGFPEFAREGAPEVITSDDGNFRMYSWDSWLGGTMHDYRSVLQWRDKGRVFTREVVEGDGLFGYFGVSIHALRIRGVRHYLLISGGVYSTSLAGRSVCTFTVDGSSLSDTSRIFHARTQSFNRIDVEFDFFKGPLGHIVFKKSSGTLLIPVVEEGGRVTEKVLAYRLKEDGFHYSGIAK